MKETELLNGTYKLTFLEYGEDISEILSNEYIPSGWIDSIVPEDVRTALKRNGIISGYHYGKNLDDERWIDEKNWIYHKRFYIKPELKGKKSSIMFDGVDTIAQVYLNGILLGKCDNMFIPHEFDVSDFLNYGGTNTLVIQIFSPVKSIEHIDRTGLFPSEDTGRLLLRKSQMNYGWDFCGHCLTTGIWKGVSLVTTDSDVLGDVFLTTEEIGAEATISITAGICRYSGDSSEKIIRITLSDENGQAAQATLTADDISYGILKVSNPVLWWPKPYGKPFLYNVRITLESGSAIVDSREFKFGIRTIKLIQDKIPEGGRSFAVSINGKRIFVRGGNWVPINSVYGEIKDSDYDPLIKRAVDANISMLRIWGGGIYESEHFFDLCDENGIMIMQDFMLACGVLPQEQWYLDLVEKEVSVIARHYRNRTCLAIWSGDNELDEAYRWYDILPQFKTNRVNRVAVKSAIEKADPTRPFLVSSPCSPFDEEDGGDDPNSPLQGDMHIYLTRFTPESEWYYRKLREFIPRFMSEYGFSSLPCYDTVKKYNFFNHKLNLTLNPWLGELPEFHQAPVNDSLQSLISATQYTHAQALKYGIEYMRSYKGICGGLLYWKFNDPYAPNRENMLFTGMMSCVDFFGKPKMVYYYSKRAYEDIILAFRETLNGAVCLCACNETDKEYKGRLIFEYTGFNKEKKLIIDTAAVIKADCVTEIYEFDEREWSEFVLQGYLRAEFKAGDIKLVNRYMLAEIQQYFHISLPDPQIKASLSLEGGELSLNIECSNYANSIEIDILDADVYYSDNFFQMDANEQKTVAVICDNLDSLFDKYLSVKAQNGDEIKFDLNSYLRFTDARLN